MKRKIISNYKIIEDQTNDLSKASKIPKVAKNTQIDFSKTKELNKAYNNPKNAIHKIEKQIEQLK